MAKTTDSTSTLPFPWDALGLALKAYWSGEETTELHIKHEDGEINAMPVSIYFRSEEELPPLEVYALSLCRGHVLDVGAGAGAHSMILQARGIKATALDIVEAGVAIMQERGLLEVICSDFLAFSPRTKFDTLLCLMNGIGIAGKKEGLQAFLSQAYQITNDQGQLILDSSELIEDASITVTYQLGYDGKWGPEYPWIYVSKSELIQAAESTGWMAQVIYEEDDGSYLARLVKQV